MNEMNEIYNLLSLPSDVINDVICNYLDDCGKNNLRMVCKYIYSEFRFVYSTWIKKKRKSKGINFSNTEYFELTNINVRSLNLKGYIFFSLNWVGSSSSSLITLNLIDCHSLKSLEGIGKLTKLEDLKLRKCKSITTLKEIGQVVSLKKLTIDSCLNLTLIPNEIGKLINLSELRIIKCKKLISISKELGKLVKLEVI